MIQHRGIDMFSSMMRITRKEEVKHFLCGGQAGLAQALKAMCKKKWSNSNVVGVYAPPFLPVEAYDYAAMARRIDASKADVIWIGLGSPKQEFFAHHLAAHTHVKLLFTVGAAFDVHAGRLRIAPAIFQRLYLEWLYRLCHQPWLIGRYASVIPRFLYYAYREYKNRKA